MQQVTGAMLGLIPFIALFLTIAIFRNIGDCSRAAIPVGASLWGAFLTLNSYLLSIFSIFSFWVVLVSWIAYLLVLGYVLYCRGWQKIVIPIITWEWYCIGGILMLTFATALLYPPTTWDSMTYHMSRVMHWWQNHSILPYYTSIPRQVELSPFAELVILHQYVLSESDILANLVQWVAFAGSIILSSAIARSIGGGYASQVGAAVFIATLPMGILQASSTQNDLVIAFWVLCIAFQYLAWRKSPSWSNALLFGLMVGLAILTKGTGYIYALPFVSAFAFRSCIKPRALLPKAMISGLFAILIFSPYMYFLYVSTGEIFGKTGKMTMVRQPGVGTLLTIASGNILSNNIIRVNNAAKLQQRFSKAMGNPESNADITHFGLPFSFFHLGYHEDYAQNFIHMPLMLLAVAVVLLLGGNDVRRYCCLWVAAVAIFCLLIRWQPWITRLQISMFVLAAPIFGRLMEMINRRVITLVVVAILFIFAIRPSLYNMTRPLLPTLSIDVHGTHILDRSWNRNRNRLYFMTLPDLHDVYYKQVGFLASADINSVGVVIGGDSWEYPLWSILKSFRRELPKIYHVPAPMERLDSPVFNNPPWGEGKWPDAIFVLGVRMPWEAKGVDANTPRVYKLVSGVYVPVDSDASL